MQPINRAIGRTALAGLLWLAAPPAFAASQYVIIAVEPAAKGLEAGKILNVGDALDVPAGVTVTLLGEDGSVSPVAGPANIKVNAEGQPLKDEKEKRSAIEKFAGLLGKQGAGAGTLGVARAFGVTRSAAGPDPWAAPADGDGQVCQRGKRFVLARADAARLAVVSARAAGGKADDLAWAAGKNVLALPEGLRAADGELEVRVDGKPALLMVHVLPATIAEDDTVAVLGWMASQGCNGQALALAGELAAKAR